MLTRNHTLTMAVAVLVAVVVVAGMALGARAPSSAPPPDAGSRMSSVGKVAFGVGVADPATDGGQLDVLSRRQTPASMVMWYQSWNEPLFYPRQFDAVESRHAVPIVTWLPDSRDGRVIAIRDVADGKYDDYLRKSADEAKAWGHPFYVRFAHEMNGDWYSWGRGVGGNRPSDYVNAWRHVVEVFRAAGANNVRWVWSPNVYGNDVASFRDFYPGDSWVDWVALDGYNFGTSGPSGWRTFAQIFDRSYQEIIKLTQKPLMIGETASAEGGGNKPAWVRQALNRDLSERFPRVKALVWFDREKEADWRVDSSSKTAQAFREAVATSHFDVTAGMISRGWPAR